MRWSLQSPGNRLPTCMLAAALLAGAGAASAEILELPVSFSVVNTNRTDVPCKGDDPPLPYVVRGHLVGPRSILEGPGPWIVTLYQYGLDTGEWNWLLTTVPGYDFPLELARDGHVSVTIDMLGYDSSGHPYGFNVCTGTQADVTNQIVTQLRGGTYGVEGGTAVPFARVVTVGHDIAGAIAEVEAYTYQDIDGLVLVTWADQGFTPYVIQLALQNDAFCRSTGGEPAEDNDPASPSGYFFMAGTDEEYATNLFHNTDPRVVAEAIRLRNRNPCGILESIPPSFTLDHARLGEIDVPVLLALGANDPVFTPDGWALQEHEFTGSSDVTSRLIEDTGHFPMLERTTPILRDLVSDWLCTRRLVSAGGLTECSTEPLLMEHARLGFGSTPAGGDDQLQLHARIPLDLGAFDSETQEFGLRLEDVDGTIYAATIPPGRFSAGSERRLRFQDMSGTIANGLRAVSLQQKTDGTVQVRAVGRDLDLSGADGSAIRVTLDVGARRFRSTQRFRSAGKNGLRFP